MKHAVDRTPCGACPPARPEPDRRGRWNAPPAPPCPDPHDPAFPPERLPRCPGGYLMQRILASGALHRRRQCYPLCLNALPEQARTPVTIVEASVCAPPLWEEADCREGSRLDFWITVPLLLRVRDGGGRLYAVQSSLQEKLRLYPRATERECWRGQMYVQAAVRLSGCATCRENPCQAPLEVLIEGYILAPSVLDACGAPACPPAKPWYPQPLYDPWNGR